MKWKWIKLTQHLCVHGMATVYKRTCLYSLSLSLSYHILKTHVVYLYACSRESQYNIALCFFFFLPSALIHIDFLHIIPNCTVRMWQQANMCQKLQYNILILILKWIFAVTAFAVHRITDDRHFAVTVIYFHVYACVLFIYLVLLYSIFHIFHSH